MSDYHAIAGSKSGEGDVIRDFAQILAHSNADVSLLAPTGSPAVTNNPVVSRRIVTDSLHAVINLPNADVQDSRVVALEGLGSEAH